MSEITLAKVEDHRVGVSFWWKSNKDAYIFLIASIADDVTAFDIKHIRDETDVGRVEWTKDEWDQAIKDKKLALAIPPVTEADLAGDEELCRSCNGTHWEQERDLEFIPCIWCERGKRKKAPPSPPKPVARSPFHPPMS